MWIYMFIRTIPFAVVVLESLKIKFKKKLSIDILLRWKEILITLRPNRGY